MLTGRMKAPSRSWRLELMAPILPLPGRPTRRPRATRTNSTTLFPHSDDRRMLLVRAGGVLPGTRHLEQGTFLEVTADELHRQGQLVDRQSGQHGERGMAGDVERRARLARIGALDVSRPVDAAGRVHRAGAEQHVDLAESRLDL